jgi:hypothetical protein
MVRIVDDRAIADGRLSATARASDQTRSPLPAAAAELELDRPLPGLLLGRMIRGSFVRGRKTLRCGEAMWRLIKGRTAQPTLAGFSPRADLVLTRRGEAARRGKLTH